jgi:hypothetical protein
MPQFFAATIRGNFIFVKCPPSKLLERNRKLLTSEDMKIKTISEKPVPLGVIGPIVDKTAGPFFGMRPQARFMLFGEACDYETLRNLVARREPR